MGCEAGEAEGVFDLCLGTSGQGQWPRVPCFSHLNRAHSTHTPAPYFYPRKGRPKQVLYSLSRDGLKNSGLVKKRTKVPKRFLTTPVNIKTSWYGIDFPFTGQNLVLEAPHGVSLLLLSVIKSDRFMSSVNLG